MPRIPTDQEYCHEQLGEKFAHALSSYDTQRRIEVLVDDFLTDEMVVGKKILDVGCGLGFFSERLVQRGAHVVACDLGPSLVEKTRQRAGCAAVVADALDLVSQFGNDAFDGVVSSECIEHVPEPDVALRQMIQVVRPGGFVSISTPNIVWGPVIKLATFCRLRPFDGHENLSSWRSIRRLLDEYGATVEREWGLHLFPFQLRLNKLSRLCDHRLQCVRTLMINICLLARKRPKA